ncbi:cirhin-like [Elysia marginata]|uniref:Cirhin-like n=1 Tax=Elysia marginata TaxID=1093978 RepID=A0AAV4GGB4_9GAST|nr:cirhin-like [Elysia marginata]
MSEATDQVKLLVHHVRFFEFQPQTINCIACDDKTQRIAVSRADGSVEILALHDNWMQEMTICGGQGASVESLIWCQGRLFAGGIGGNVVGFDLQQQKPKTSISSNAGPIWCLTKNSKDNKIAAGTEDGCVVLFDVSDELQFLRGFAKQEGRILSLAWYDQDGESIIISGSINNIRQWSVKSGQPISRMTLGRKFDQDTIVWCVTVTKDFTIISGDSRGIVTFWNGKEATQLKTFHCHKADVLSLCLSEDETEAFSGSVDAALFQFSLCNADHVTERKRWVHQPLHWRHTHDVRALAYTGGYLVSGGVDTNLFVAKLKGVKRVLNVAPVPKHNLINISRESNLVLLQYSTHLEVWRLGSANTPFAEERGMLPLTQKRLKLLVLKAREDCEVICSSISASGTVLGFSDNRGIRVFTLTIESQSSVTPEVSLQRMSTVSAHTPPAHLMAFTPKGSHLVVALASGTLSVSNLTNGQTKLLESRPTGWKVFLGSAKIHRSVSYGLGPATARLAPVVVLILCKNRDQTPLKMAVRKSKGLMLPEKKNYGHKSDYVAKTCYKFKYLLFADFTSNGMLVAVERPLSQMEDNLPPSFKQKKFGVS